MTKGDDVRVAGVKVGNVQHVDMSQEVCCGLIRILQEAKGGPFRLRAGYCAVADLALSNLDLNQLVQRAETALHTVPSGENTDSAVSFDEL